jgi:hypothetical protein
VTDTANGCGFNRPQKCAFNRQRMRWQAHKAPSAASGGKPGDTGPVAARETTVVSLLVLPVGRAYRAVSRFGLLNSEIAATKSHKRRINVSGKHQ